jgi:DNA-binding transcriptional LysR family regulator
MADALHEVAEVASGQRGHIRLGLGTSVAETLLPAVSLWHRTETDEVTLAIQVGLNDSLRHSLADGQLDGIITTGLPDDAATLTREDWAEDDVVVVAHAGHELSRCVTFSMEDMSRFNWVLTARAVASRQWLDNAFTAQGLPPPRVQVEIDSMQLVATFIDRTEMLGFVPRRSLSAGRLGTGLVEIRNEHTTMRRTLSFLCRKGGYISPALRRLKLTLQAAIQDDGASIAHKLRP